MIAVDTQILIYATRLDSEWHAQARPLIEDLGGGADWAIPWPCIYEFVRILTQPGIFDPPSTLEDAFRAIESWRRSRGLVLLCEGQEHLETLKSIAIKGRATGSLIHDARIAAICLVNGVRELWSADRDFSRFPDLKVVNPLVR